MNLKRKGPRFLGLCPFHNEKTPSFNVVPAMGHLQMLRLRQAATASAS
ncbi:MAG: hypothetical protein IPH53_22625 [Flavobacteriales bacterium]|nr:hypothetical protein [Flavobacteriales bacterium]